MLRLAILASHPIQYQVPLFRALAARGDVALKVFFCWDFGIKKTIDPEFGQSFAWDIPLLDGYDHELLPNLSRDRGTNQFWGLFNPTAPARIAAFKPDALVVHGYAHFTELEVLAAACITGIPTLIRGDSTLVFRRPPHVLAAKRLMVTPLFKSLSGALASGALNARYYAQYGIPEDRILHAPFTVDNAFFHGHEDDARTAARAIRSKLGIGEKDVTVLFAAKLLSHKGCGDLIHAFGAKPRQRAHLVIVGDGPQREEFTQLADEVAPGRVHFIGFVNQKSMPAAYAVGDVFVLPSHYEPWGLAINEAMCLGLPIIASDQVGAVPDLVLPDNGWVFPAGDIAALTTVLDAALDDRDGLARRGAASRRHIAAWDIPQTATGFVRAALAVSSFR